MQAEDGHTQQRDAIDRGGVDDAALIARCLAQDERAWRSLVDRHADLVYGIARRGGLDDAAAQDVVQDVFLALVKHLRRFRHPERLVGWLVKASRRATWRASQQRRSRARRDAEASRPDRDPTPLPRDVLVEHERRHRLRLAMDQIGARCRRLLQALFLGEDADYKSLSHELGIAVGSIGPIRRRCMRKLLPHLEQAGLVDEFEKSGIAVSGAGGSPSSGLDARSPPRAPSQERV